MSRKTEQRDAFRRAVMARAGGACEHCGATGVKLDAHHIIPRKQAPNGGYVASNGIALCDTGQLSACHYQAETADADCPKYGSAALFDIIGSSESKARSDSYLLGRTKPRRRVRARNPERRAKSYARAFSGSIESSGTADDRGAIIRRMPCILRGIGDHVCRGDVQACHARARGTCNKGKADETYPGCMEAHAVFGEYSTRPNSKRQQAIRKYGVDPLERARELHRGITADIGAPVCPDCGEQGDHSPTCKTIEGRRRARERMQAWQ